MTVQESDLKGLTVRLQKLEKQNRRLKGVGGLVLALTCSLFLIGQAAPKSQTLEAERFIVKDKAGIVRATLGTNTDGSLILALFYENSKEAVVLSVHKGMAGLGVHDERGGRAGLWVVDGAPGLSLQSRDGTVRTTLALGNKDSPILSLFDARGELRAMLGMDEAGSPALGLRHKDGTLRAGLAVKDADGLSALEFYSEDMKVIWKAP